MSRGKYRGHPIAKNGESMKICPQPNRWHRVHQALLTACRGENINELPPIPLILNGWFFTSDLEKADRWAETVRWAERYGLSDLTTVPAEDWYSVEKPSRWVNAPLNDGEA